MFKKLFASAFLISLGGALPLLSSLVLLIPYTRNLSISDYGALFLYIGFTLLMQALMNYGLDTYVAVHNFEHKDDPQRLKKFVGTAVTYLLIIGAFLILIMSVFGNSIFNLAFKKSDLSFYPYGFMSVITAFFNNFFKNYTFLVMYRQQPVRYFLLNLFNFVLTIAISLYGLYLYPHTLIGPMWGRFLSGAGIFSIALFFYLKEYGISFNVELTKGFHKFCLPILIFAILSWVLTYINSFIINANGNTADVGVYGFALNCTLLVDYFQTGIVGTINPRIYGIWKKNGLTKSTQEENRLYNVFTMVSLLFIALNILIIPIMVPLVIKNTGYLEGLRYFPILCVSFIFKPLSILYTNPLYYFKKTKALPRILIVFAVFQIFCGILFIRYFGIWGAVWTLLLVRVFQLLPMRLEGGKVFHFKLNKYKLIVLPVLYTVIVVFINNILHLYGLYANIISFFIGLLLLSTAYYKEIKTSPDFIKEYIASRRNAT